MDKVIVEKHVVDRDVDSGSRTGSNAVWAIAMVIVVAIIAGVLYYSGVLRYRPAQNKVNVDVTAPSR